MDNLGMYIKAFITSVFTAVSLKFSGLGNLLWLFFAAVALDYLMGVSAAVYNRELSSAIGFRGIIKKVGAFAAIAVALIADQVIQHAAGSLDLPFYAGDAIAAAVTVWLILNELISVLENIGKMNVALPSFLTQAVKTLKDKASAKDKETQSGGQKGGGF